MDTTTLAAIIASGTTIIGTGITAFISRRTKIKEKREAERNEEREREEEHRSRLFSHMLEIRETTRHLLTDFSDTNEKIRAHTFDADEWRSITRKIADTTSEHTDMVIGISAYHPAVTTHWFEFINIRSSYVEAIKNHAGGYDALAVRTEALLGDLATARDLLVTELKAAAAGMGLPPLLHDLEP